MNHAAAEKLLALLLLGDVFRVRSAEPRTSIRGAVPSHRPASGSRRSRGYTCALGLISADGKSLVLYEVLSFLYRFDIHQRPHLSLVVKNFDRFGLNSAYLYILL